MDIFKRVMFGTCAAIVVLTFLFTGPSPAEAKKLNVNFDYATFRYDSLKTYMELYYSFSAAGAHLVKKDSSFTGLLLFEVLIKPLNSDTVLNQQMWKVPLNATDTAASYLTHSLVGEVTTALVPGAYRLFVNVIDQNDTTDIDTVRENIDIPKYLPDNLSMSDVELCSSITSDETNRQSMFYKNTYDVVPNPTGVWGAGLPIVYYYFEVYNISQRPDDSTFTVGYQVRDSFGNVYKSFSKMRKKFSNSSVEVGTVNASDLKTGAYAITFTVMDSTANLFATSSKKFFVYNPNLGTPIAPSSNMAGSAVLSSAFAAMGEEELDNEFAEARYVAASAERDQFKNLSSIDAKRQFMYDFWNKRDNSTENNVSDQRSDYLQRVAYANDHFRTGYRPGWKTDRGRVYIMYGNPDEIDRHPNETDSKPYEVWSYNSLEGGASFDFIDRNGFGDYQLVNSTERNEIHDDNWQQYLNATN